MLKLPLTSTSAAYFGTDGVTDETVAIADPAADTTAVLL